VQTQRSESFHVFTCTFKQLPYLVRSDQGVHIDTRHVGGKSRRRGQTREKTELKQPSPRHPASVPFSMNVVATS
jgi:hypothetical protein